MTDSKRVHGRPARELIRRLYESKSLFVLVTMAVAGISLLVTPNLITTSKYVESILVAVGTGLLATTLFSSVHIFFTNVEFVELLSDRIAKQQNRATREIIQHLSLANQTYYPTAVYGPEDGESTAFNSDLMGAIRESRTYRFQGLTGYFVPLRLEASDTTLALLRLSIADPLDRASLRIRASREVVRRKGKDFEEVRKTIEHKVHLCLVGLMEVRGRCQEIQIRVGRELASDRYEILDNDVFLTLYDTSLAPMTEYPGSLRFGRQSLFYDLLMRQFDLRFSSQETRIVSILPDESDEEIREKFEVFGLPNSEEWYSARRDEFRLITRDYSRTMQGLVR